ncbi:MAG: chromosome segregation protein SMC [Clostridia bacterium]|nr:chromosome segregation protein SMC [Clostridia bacterium]
MQGFKSFADTIELSFSEGITAIVGPNGSGKSNISDAVRWVLGEQSAKTLRGSKMEDVIFNGTQTRKRLGFAEVTLKLDNHDRHFNMDFDDISVTRKVFASGESQYLINDTPCRLKDIHEIFMDTGLGRDGYSMVGQGKIDEILSNKSEDRREIFEEAAGISKYRYRKEEAERKLKHTDENLDRVADIITELESQIGPLEQQAEKAKKYLNLRDQLRLFEVNLALNTVERSRTQGSTLEEKLQAVREQLTKKEAELTVADSEQEQCYTRFEELDRAMAETDGALKSAEENIGISQREIEVLKSTIEGNLRLIERIEQEKRDLTAGKQALEQSVRDEQSLLEKLTVELEEIKKEKDALTEQLTNFDEDADVHSDQIEALKKEITEAFERVSESKIKSSNLELLEQNIQSRRRSLELELSEREGDLTAQQERAGNLDAEYERKLAFVKELEEQTREAREAELALQEKIEKKRAELTSFEIQLNQKKTRLHLLTEMEQNFEGYYKSVKEIMKQHESGMLKSVGIHGPVSKLFQVDSSYATAIGVAIGGALQNIVVDTETDAKKSIECLKHLGAGRATFMPISAVSGSLMDASRLEHEPGYIGIAAQLVSYDAKYTGIIQNLLGKTVVVEHIDQAIAISKKYKQTLRIVTLEGESFYPGGSIAGGSQQKGNQLLSREQEIKELQKELKSLENKCEGLERELKSLESAYLDAAQEQEKYGDVYRENKEVLLVLERDKEHHGVLLSTLAAAINDLKQSISSVEEERKGLAGQREEAARLLAEAEQTIAEKRAEVNALEETYETVAVKKQRISDSVLEKTFEQTAKEREMEQSREKMESLAQEIAQADTHISLRAKEMEEIIATNQEHNNSIDEKEKNTIVLSNEIKQHRKTIASITEERQTVEQRLRSLQGNSNDARETVYSLKTEVGRLEAQKEKLENEAEAAVTRLWDEYEITFSEAEALRQDLGSDSAMSKQVSSLRSKIRELGNVNVDAIEELSAVSERYQFLNTQRDDLQKAKRDLIKIIEEMQSIMKRQFKEQFDKINQNFKTTFTELFGGGNADLRLEDETDILECGIEINVQPPGKKLQSLSLLSGGERALSAIALLFAILKIKPTPFCFLDEIEAALDENNVYRYADFIKRFSRRTQFILVTHRRGTMECADVIYGVTMQEKGVSKLLELNLEEIEAK